MMESTKSKNFEKIKGFFDKKLWDLERVYNVVNIGLNGITEEEYEEIAGEAYKENE